MKIIKIIPLLLACPFLFSACAKKHVPTPDQTLLGGVGAQRPDWVDVAGIYGAGAEGLELRDASFDQSNVGNHIENLLPSVLFNFDQSDIRPDERTKLVRTYNHLLSHPGDLLLIEGHCDWRGTSEYNLALGDRRANSVRTYLERLGIENARIETVSQGDLEATTQGTSEQMQQDRRADLIILR